MTKAIESLSSGDLTTLRNALSIQTPYQHTPSVPSAWNTAWTCTTWKPTVTVYRHPVAPYGSVGITPDALFDLFSTARSAPNTTFYADASKADDTGNGLTAGTAKKSIHACVTLANATGLPCKIIVAAGSYPRINNFSNGSAVLPTVDIAFVASGGRTVVGTWDDFAPLSADATQTNCYVLTVSNVNRVVDRSTSDRFGNMVDLLNVSSAAICNRTPGSQYYSGTVLYINRADGAPVTNTNTRIYRSAVANFKSTANVNILLSVAGANAVWALEGGSSAGCFSYAPTTTPGSFKCVVAQKCSFQYGGGIVDTAATGVSINSIHGVAAFFECEADANWTDGFNCHNSTAAAATSKVHFVTVNCTGFDNGRGTAQSCNGWTTHETAVGLDVTGVYKNNRGGTYRSINSTISWLVNPVVRDDMGDLTNGGSQPPAAFVINDTGSYYIDSPVVDMPGTGQAFFASSTAAIYLRNAMPSRNSITGTGTIGTY